MIWCGVQLYFARHAQSQNNAIERSHDYLTARFEDPGITELGWKQAAALAGLLAGHSEPVAPRTEYRNPWNHLGFDLTRIYCSFQRRAVETSRVVSERVGVPVTAWTPIHETGGIIRYDPRQERFEGQPGATPTVLREWNPAIEIREEGHDAGWWQSRPMEQDAQVRQRAAFVRRHLLEWHGHTDDRVLLVSHGTFYNYPLCEFLGIELRNELWFPPHKCGLSRNDTADGSDFEPGMDGSWKRLDGMPVRVAYLNRLDHIPPHLIS